jgi:hypothetical protein
MTAVLAPSTLARKRGSRLLIISLETSVKKLATLAAHTFRGSLRTDDRPDPDAATWRLLPAPGARVVET